MLLKFSPHGKTTSKKAGTVSVKYLCEEEKPNGDIRTEEPEVLRGDPEEVAALINSISRDYKYTGLIISFAENEYDELLANDILNEFEKFAFPGLEKNDYTYLASLHTDTKNKHIHILVPKENLRTGTELNIAPLAQQKQWHLWSDYVRDKYNLKPIDNNNIDKSPLSSKEKMALSKGNLSTHSKAKIELDKFIKENIGNGLLASRSDIKKLLESIDMVEKVELKQNSMSVKIKGIDKNIRLEKGVYGITTINTEADFKREINRQICGEAGRVKGQGYSDRDSSGSDEKKAIGNKFNNQGHFFGRDDGIQKRYEKVLGRRTRFNEKRYKQPTSSNISQKSETLSRFRKEFKTENSSVKLDYSNKHTTELRPIPRNNIQTPTSIKPTASNNALTNSVSDTIASLEDKLKATTDPAERADILNQLESLLPIKYEQQKQKLKL